MMSLEALAQDVLHKSASAIPFENEICSKYVCLAL